MMQDCDIKDIKNINDIYDNSDKVDLRHFNPTYTYLNVANVANVAKNYTPANCIVLNQPKSVLSNSTKQKAINVRFIEMAKEQFRRWLNG